MGTVSVFAREKRRPRLDVQCPFLGVDRRSHPTMMTMGPPLENDVPSDHNHEGKTERVQQEKRESFFRSSFREQRSYLSREESPSPARERGDPERCGSHRDLPTSEA